MRNIPKHYAYRIDHDVGFAPCAHRGVCTLCGCKTTTVERYASKGSWIVGIGGNRTGKPDALIYAMRVQSNPQLGAFAKRFPRRGAHLLKQGIPIDAPVLVSRHFWYFGDHAIKLPRSLAHIIISGRSYKKLSNGDVIALERFLSSRHYAVGAHGKPNNPAYALRLDPSHPCSAGECKT